MTAPPEAGSLPDSVQLSSDETAGFAVTAAPTDTSSIAIATSLVDDDVIASNAGEIPSSDDAANASELSAKSIDPAKPFEETAVSIEAEPVLAESVLVEPELTPAAAEPAPLYTEPAAEAAAVPDDTPPPSSQSAQTIGRAFTPSHKDFIMDMTTNFGSGLNDVVSGAQDKAKEAFEKGSSMLGEVGSFARGNVEAVVESGKILAAGLQDMSTNLVAEGRTSFETMTADLKELAASKTPADFFKAQSEIMRKSLDSAVATGSKNSEAMLKLVSDMMAPLSGRMNLAVEKVKMPLA